MADDPKEVLSAAELARRAGLAAGTLRMWRVRHGFPDAPGRGPHRRYGARDLEAVLEVRRLRDDGLSLGAAIARARRATPAPPSSIYAGLRLAHPALAPVPLRKPALLALTRAIEDEYLAAAGAGGLLIGSFQRASFYRASERRWRELSRTSSVAVALADFERRCSPPHGPIELPLPRAHALNREWAVIIDAPPARACLAGLERPRPSAGPDRERLFEVLWSFDPSVVAAARRVAEVIVGEIEPAAGALVASADSPGNAAADVPFTSSLAQRAVAYLAELAAP